MAYICVFNELVQAVVKGTSYTEIEQTFSVLSEGLEGPRQRDPVAWVCMMAGSGLQFVVPKIFSEQSVGGVDSGTLLASAVFPFVSIAEILNATGNSNPRSSEDSIKWHRLAEELYSCLFQSLQFSICGGVSHWPEKDELMLPERRALLIQVMFDAGAHEVHSKPLLSTVESEYRRFLMICSLWIIIFSSSLQLRQWACAVGRS